MSDGISSIESCCNTIVGIHSDHPGQIDTSFNIKRNLPTIQDESSLYKWNKSIIRECVCVCVCM